MPRLDPPSLPPSFLGVLVGAAWTFLLFARRGKPPQADAAELLLQQATRQMKEAQAENRERAVQAITQKNNLQAIVDQTRKRVEELEARAQAAREEGDAEREGDLRAERDKYRETLTQVEASLGNAVVTTEAVKTAMRQEEERIRLKPLRRWRWGPKTDRQRSKWRWN